MATDAARTAKWKKYYDDFPKNFWKRVDRSGGPEVCWPYKGTKYPSGYGRLQIHGRYELAHRVAYRLHTGEEVDEVHILHGCDNPCCCNPSHLRAGTHTDNMQDRSARGRAPMHRAKLSPEQVDNIRQKLAEGCTGSSLAKEHNVGQTAISRIRTGKTWGNAALEARPNTGPL